MRYKGFFLNSSVWKVQLLTVVGFGFHKDCVRNRGGICAENRVLVWITQKVIWTPPAQEHFI